jgi:hypothetical protein
MDSSPRSHSWARKYRGELEQEQGSRNGSAREDKNDTGNRIRRRSICRDSKIHGTYVGGRL